MPGHPRLSTARVVGFFVGVAVFWWIWSSVLPGAPKLVVEEGTQKDKVVQPPPTGPKPCPAKEFTVEQVLEHTKCNFNMGEFDLWLVIDGNVYNVDEWAPRHPGGPMICAAAGIDSSKMFRDNHHQPYIRDVALPHWCIGKLKAGETMPAKFDKEAAKAGHASHGH